MQEENHLCKKCRTRKKFIAKGKMSSVLTSKNTIGSGKNEITFYYFNFYIKHYAAITVRMVQIQTR